VLRRVAAIVALLMCCGRFAAADPEHGLKGRRLDDALRILQRSGLQIVFSSEIVTPDMRVVDEPRAPTPRQQLDELLEGHGLRAEPGPGAVIQVVRRRSGTAIDTTKKRAAPTTSINRHDASTTAASRSEKEPSGFTDRVTVIGTRTARTDRGVSEVAFDAPDLEAGSSILQDDGLRAVQAMPQVAAVDDFRSEFSVRGSPYRQIGVVIDGVSTPWLEHRVYGRRDAGSLSMFGSAILDRAVLQAGTYPRRYDDVLGAQLQLTLREGSRASTHFSGSAGGISTAFVGEGPIGAGARGSWIATVRNSYRSWPAKQLTQNDVGFAFADGHAKLVYDVAPMQQFEFTVLGGRSTPDTVDEPLVSPIGSGIDHAALLTAGWRSTLSSRTVIRQRLSFVGQKLLSTSPTGQLAGRSSNQALGYRGVALHELFGGVLEAGTEVRRLSGVRDVESDGPAALRGQFGASWWTRSAYASFARTTARGASLAGGVRASQSTLVGKRAVAPWIVGAWQFKPGWTLNATAGTSRQFPDLDAIRGLTQSSDLRPERAALVDAGVEQRLPNGIRWRMTFYTRAENDVLRAPALQPMLVQGIVLDPPSPRQYRNSLRGTSRGIDLLVARDGAARLSGWIAYGYATTRQADISTQESFWGDLDRRHALNAAGVLRITRATTAGIVFRGASGVPVPGYFDVKNGTLFVGARRNEVRLPAYMRLDTRMQRTFFSSRHHLTLFGEILNVLNRPNRGTAEGFIRPFTGEAFGFSQSLMARCASIGIEIDFHRDHAVPSSTSATSP
jgi:hypothetical protein